MQHERRQFVRVTFEAPAQLTTTQEVLSVHVLDVSLKGALITTPAGGKLPSGTRGRLKIPLGGPGAHITMAVEAMHVTPKHTGLKCQAIDLDSVTHLRRVIEMQLGATYLLDRDLAELAAGS